MTVTISLTPEAEARRRQQAAAAGVEASRYAADLVEKFRKQGLRL